MIQFSIIIPTSNRPLTLKLLLDSIVRNGFERKAFEVIVIENGRAAVSKELCLNYRTELDLKYYYQKTEGFSAAQARNIGIRISVGKMLLFFDDDVILKSNCLKEHLLLHCKNSNPKVVFGFRDNILNDLPNNLKQGTIERDYRRMLDISNPEKLWYYAYTCNLSITVSNEKHFFDEGFKTWGNEDQEFAYRLYKSGFKVMVGKNCLVHHITDSKIRSPFLRERYGLDFDYSDFLQSRILFVKKHWDDEDFRNFIIEDLKLYSYTNNKWVRNKIPNLSFEFGEFVKILNASCQ